LVGFCKDAGLSEVDKTSVKVRGIPAAWGWDLDAVYVLDSNLRGLVADGVIELESYDRRALDWI
jgi:hypothetical protein